MQNVGKKFIPLPPFSSLASVGYYAGMCGSIAAVQSFTSGGLTAARGRQDVWNEFFGVAAGELNMSSSMYPVVDILI